MKHFTRRIIALFMAVIMAVTCTPYDLKANKTNNSDRYVVLSVEGLSLGQGFYILPARMSYDEIQSAWDEIGVDIDTDNLTVSQASYAFFAKAGISTEPGLGADYADNDFYLSCIENIDKGTTDIPDSIIDVYRKIHGSAPVLLEKSGTDLCEYDYTDTSGWMVSVDNRFINSGAGGYVLSDNADNEHTNVIRWQYSLFDYGADLGEDNGASQGSIPAYYTSCDKSKLYTLFAENYDLISTYEDAYSHIMSVMTEPAASDDDIEWAISQIKSLLDDGCVDVEIKMNSVSSMMSLKDSSGNDIQTGDPQGYVYSLRLKPDTYTLTAYATDNETINGTVEIVVDETPSQSFTVYTVTNIYCANTGWTESSDYQISHVLYDSSGALRNSTLGRMSNNPDRYSAICLLGDSLSVTVTPLADKTKEYMPKTASATITSNRSFGFNISSPLKRSVTITVPKEAELVTGQLTNSFTYSTLSPVSGPQSDESAGTDTYSYTYANGGNYYYKVSMEGAVTYWNWVSVNEDSEFTVTEDDLYLNDDTHNPDTVIDDLTANKYDVADIYMNVNSQGYINLSEGETVRLECYRNWQAIESISNAKIAEPDFHYTIIDEYGNVSDDVIEIIPGDNSAVTDIKAVGRGTAIVLVTYDAMTNMASQNYGGTFFSAIWPENTGVIVISVGDNADMDTGMTINEGLNTSGDKLSFDDIDAELDVLYYTNGENGASYTFIPESNTEVSVLRPHYTDGGLSYSGFSTAGVTYNDDGSVTVSALKCGSNIIKVSKGGNSVYQVIRAKETNVEYTYTDADGNIIGRDELKPGCSIDIRFGEDNSLGASCKGIYIPANKLAGIYNMSGTINLTDMYGNEYKGAKNQYLFADTISAQTVNVTIPKYCTSDTYTFSGNIYESGYGSEYGLHRELTHERGKTAQFTALMREGYFGMLPHISLPVSDNSFKMVDVEVTDSQNGKDISDYTLIVKDSTDNVAYLNDGSFPVLDDEMYTYEIYTPGYNYAMGEVSGQSVQDGVLTIELNKANEGAWDGISMTKPECDLSGVYQIRNGAELAWFAGEVNRNASALSAALACDIDLAGYRWTPIGTSAKPFAGVFDGNGHTISGLFVYDTGYAGLFGSSKGVIMNLTVQGEISTAKDYAGGIAGELKAGSGSSVCTVKDCVSDVDISAPGANYAGGIAGYSKASEIFVTACSNYGDITALSGVGGIIGCFDNLAQTGAAISDCYNAGVITGTDKGMIIGYNDGCIINNCYNFVDMNDNTSEYIDMMPLYDISGISVENVQKSMHYDEIYAVYYIYEKLSGTALLDSDEKLISNIPVLIDIMNNQKEVTVEALDYTAGAANIDRASETGVIISCRVCATDAADAVTKAMTFNDIDYEMNDGYVSSINGLGHVDEYYMSGWMLSYNDDDCDNYGINYITLNDNDKLSFRYSVTGGDDIAAASAGLPTLKELIIGDMQFSMYTYTEYDEYWNPTYTYYINDQKAYGEGTVYDPFIIDLKLPQGSTLTYTEVSYSLYADSHFAHVSGLYDNMDITGDVSFYVSSDGGRIAYYVITQGPEGTPTDAPTAAPPSDTPSVIPSVTPSATPTVTPAATTPSAPPLSSSDTTDTSVESEGSVAEKTLKKGDIVKDSKYKALYKVTKVSKNKIIVKYHKSLKKHKKIKLSKYIYTEDGIRCKVKGMTKKAVKSFKKKTTVKVPKAQYRVYKKLLKNKNNVRLKKY